MKTTKSMNEFKETYLPIEAEAEKASKMTKGEFWMWYSGLTDEKQEQIKVAMLELADSHHRKNCHILHLLGY